MMDPTDVIVAPPVAEAIVARRPVVALETTLVTHGFPHPEGLEIAAELEAAVAAGGAQPATIGIIDGRIRVGLERAELERLLLIRLFQETPTCCDRLPPAIVLRAATPAPAAPLMRRDLRLARRRSCNTRPPRHDRAGLGTQRGSRIPMRRRRFSARCRREQAAEAQPAPCGRRGRL